MKQKELGDMIPGEKEKSEAALLELPESVRDFYEPHYQIVGSLAEGTFVGLVCKVCHHWRDCRHEPNCPVAKLEQTNKLKENTNG